VIAVSSERRNDDNFEFEWRRFAHCRQTGTSPDTFFPEDENGDEPPVATPEIDQVCGKCVVRGTCLLLGREQDAGFYGGLSTEERRALWNVQRIVPSCIRCDSTALLDDGEMTTCTECDETWPTQN
jgi:Transcription factor WhiB